MQFEGTTLHGILLHQTEPVVVIYVTGAMLTAMARELVTQNGVGEFAAAVWRQNPVGELQYSDFRRQAV